MGAILGLKGTISGGGIKGFSSPVPNRIAFLGASCASLLCLAIELMTAKD
jgi:hypothetical protein